MSICFIPGYACRSEIFNHILADFPDSFCIEWPLEKMNEIDSMGQLCNWVLKAYKLQLAGCDAFIGHSLGGGVAFELSFLSQFEKAKVILVDYFLRTPPSFFRNYCSIETPKIIHENVQKMLEETKPYFNPALMDSIKEYTSKRLQKRETLNGNRLCAIYGMRSETNEKKVVDALEIPREMKQFIDLRFIRYAAHFPMLEQPEMFIQTLNDVLGMPRC